MQVRVNGLQKFSIIQARSQGSLAHSGFRLLANVLTVLCGSGFVDWTSVWAGCYALNHDIVPGRVGTGAERVAGWTGFDCRHAVSSAPVPFPPLAVYEPNTGPGLMIKWRWSRPRAPDSPGLVKRTVFFGFRRP